jgi:hypothetical protein
MRNKAANSQLTRSAGVPHNGTQISNLLTIEATSPEWSLYPFSRSISDNTLKIYRKDKLQQYNFRYIYFSNQREQCLPAEARQGLSDGNEICQAPGQEPCSHQNASSQERYHYEEYFTRQEFWGTPEEQQGKTRHEHSEDPPMATEGRGTSGDQQGNCIRNQYVARCFVIHSRSHNRHAPEHRTSKSNPAMWRLGPIFWPKRIYLSVIAALGV